MTKDEPNQDGCSGKGDFASLIAEEDANIGIYGFQYSLVFGGGDEPGFVYTSGLAEKGLPEFIFVGSSQAQSHQYIASFIEAALAGETIPTGLVPAGNGEGMNPFAAPAWVVRADDKLNTHAFGVRSRLDRVGSTIEPTLLQIVMPSMEGLFPWEQGYRWMDQQVENPIRH